MSTYFVQNPPSDQKASAVGGGIIGQSNLDAVLGQLVRIGGFYDDVTVNARIGDLTGDVLVCETDDQPVNKMMITVRDRRCLNLN